MIADARDNVRPEIVGSVATGDGAFGVFVRGNIAYVGGCFPPGFTAGSLKVIDVADRRQPRLLCTLADSARYGCTCDFQQKVYGMAVKDGLLYLAGRDSRYFLVVDPARY